MPTIRHCLPSPRSFVLQEVPLALPAVAIARTGALAVRPRRPSLA